MKLLRSRKLLLTFTLLLLICAGGYYFFMKTNRGSSIALYIAGGWHAPTKVKWECAQDTDIRVAKKFELPLAFDEHTKDQLRGFWYYSYYRDCLAAHGYDFKGNAIPSSSVDQNGTAYTNTYGGFSFNLPGSTTITTDNDLNVDYDDRLFASKLTLDGVTLAVDTYQKYENFTSFEALAEKYSEHPFSKEMITDARMATNTEGTRTLVIDQADGTTRIVSVTPEAKVIDIHGAALSASLIEAITSSLKAR